MEVPWEFHLKGAVLFYNCSYIPDAIWTKINHHVPLQNAEFILTNKLLEVHDENGIEVKIGYMDKASFGYDGFIKKGKYYFPYQDNEIFNNHAIRPKDPAANISIYVATDMNALDKKRFTFLSQYQPIIFDGIQITKCHRIIESDVVKSRSDIAQELHEYNLELKNAPYFVSYQKRCLYPFNLEKHGQLISSNYPKIDFKSIHISNRVVEKKSVPTWFERWILWEKPYDYTELEYRNPTESEAICNCTIFVSQYIDSGLLYLIS